jgi:hypothetical protein
MHILYVRQKVTTQELQKIFWSLICRALLNFTDMTVLVKIEQQ